ncbi:MAG: PH domain-containing protein [Candidatus Hodarchaeales archaeon]
MNQVTIIRPEKGEGTFPTPEVRIITPSKVLIWKFYFTAFLVWICIGIGLFTIFGFFNFIDTIDSSPSDISSFFFGNFFFLVFWGLSILVSILIAVLIPIYVNSMEFIVHGDEVVVKKGIINKTVKFCPYRTVTNISTTAGPLDRLFGIGCVNIQTAGKSGTSTAPEEKFEGLPLYHEIRDYILRQLRVYHKGISSGAVTDDQIVSSHKIKGEIIHELREIKGKLKEN